MESLVAKIHQRRKLSLPASSGNDSRYQPDSSALGSDHVPNAIPRLRIQSLTPESFCNLSTIRSHGQRSPALGKESNRSGHYFNSIYNLNFDLLARGRHCSLLASLVSVFG